MSTVVFITGSNRGIGRGLVQRFLRLPDHTVIAASRDLGQPSTRELFWLPRAQNTRLLMVKLDITIWQDAFDAVKSLEGQIDHIDIVIGNAGVFYNAPTVADVKLEDIEGHFKPNAYGQVALFQATRELLKKSQKEPILTYLGSPAGSVSSPMPFPNAAYGPSKSALAWYTVKIHMEEDWLNSFSLNPGWVHTDMGDAGAVALGADETTKAQMMISLDESCDGMMKVLAKTNKAEHGGKFISYTGEVQPW